MLKLHGSKLAQSQKRGAYRKRQAESTDLLGQGAAPNHWIQLRQLTNRWRPVEWEPLQPQVQEECTHIWKFLLHSFLGDVLKILRVLRKRPIVVQKWRSGTATTEGEVQNPIVTFLPISPKEQSPNVHWVGVEKGNNVWVLVRTHCSWRKGIEKTTLYHWVGCKIHAGFEIIVLGGAGTLKESQPHDPGICCQPETEV